MLNIILLGITSLLTDISSEMVYPLLPVYLVSKLGASPAILGLIEGVAESLASLLKVFSGYFSDRLKRRKPFTILGYAASTAGKFILYISTAWVQVFAARLIDRAGKGIRTAPRDALIVDSAQSDKRGAAFGLHRAMDTLGAAAGVMLAYLLITKYRGDFKNIFLFSLIPAFLGLLILFLVKEPLKSELSKKEKPRFKWRLLDRRLKIFLLFSFIFTLGNSSNQFLLLRAQTLGSSIPVVLLFYLFYNLIYALVSYPASKLSDKMGRKKLLVTGYVFYALVYFGFALNGNVQNFWFLFGVYGMYIGFTEGVEKALLADIAPKDLRATAIGLHATIVGVGLLPASILAGMFWKFFGPAVPFYFGGIMSLFAVIGFWFVLKGL